MRASIKAYAGLAFSVLLAAGGALAQEAAESQGFSSERLARIAPVLKAEIDRAPSP